ncbi:hypothetical protein XENOCAPTIV_000893, partial [Xenoophorus captivus]
CGHLLEEIKCARCSPNAQVLFHSLDMDRMPHREPDLPRLCQDYCREFYYTCRGHIPDSSWLLCFRYELSLNKRYLSSATAVFSLKLQPHRILNIVEEMEVAPKLFDASTLIACGLLHRSCSESTCSSEDFLLKRCKIIGGCDFREHVKYDETL